MKNERIFSASLICCLLLLMACTFLYLQNDSLRRESNSNLSNFIAADQNRLHETNGHALEMQLRSQEFDQRESELKDSLNKVRGNYDKIRHLKGVVKASINDVRKQDGKLIDTVYFGLPGKFTKVEMSECLGIELFYPTDSSLVQVRSKLHMKLVLAIHEGNRIKQHRIFGFNLFRTGPRLTNYKMFNNCGDSTKVEVEAVTKVRD